MKAANKWAVFYLKQHVCDMWAEPWQDVSGFCIFNGEAVYLSTEILFRVVVMDLIES